MKKLFYLLSLSLFFLNYSSYVPNNSISQGNIQAKKLANTVTEGEVVKRTLHSPDYSKTYTCYDYFPNGYAIFDESNTKLEFNPNSHSPYYEMGNGTYLYGGPMEYDFVPNKLYVNKVNAINKLADIEKLSQNNGP
ncbi:MAG: hypothetical protein PUA93_03845 [Eubacteriales bacterium]|nr:hypothetical protein [Eubacteriales bacterium]